MWSPILFDVECSSLQKTVKSYNVNQPLQITLLQATLQARMLLWFRKTGSFPKS